MTAASWLSTQKMLARAEPILRRLPAGRPKMVELGVFTGFMAAHLLGRRPDLSWHGVDDWLPKESQPESYRQTKDMHAHATEAQQAAWRAQAKAALLPFDGRASIHEKRSVEAAAEFADDSVDIVFCDADHSYEGVLADMLAWWPKVRPGGWMASHDFGNQDPRYRFDVDRAVKEFAATVGLPLEVDAGHTVWVRKPPL